MRIGPSRFLHVLEICNQKEQQEQMKKSHTVVSCKQVNMDAKDITESIGLSVCLRLCVCREREMFRAQNRCVGSL